MSGAPLLAADAQPAAAEADEFFDANDAETVATIKDLIETRVRPAVAGDGGDITFKGYKEGIVFSADEGRLLGLPVLDRHAPARHPEPAQAFRARRGRSAAGVSSVDLQLPRMPGSSRASASWVATNAWMTGSSPRHDGARLTMRVLAIDTALEACSAAVLDTERAGVVAHESLPMVRGHAEALMPLIARVLDARRLDFRRARPHRRHHRTRQLHRLARRHFRRARDRARRRQAGGRPVHARRLRRALHRRRRHAAGGGGDRCAARSRLSAGVRARRPHAGCAAAGAVARSAARGGDRRAAPDRHRGQYAGGGLAGRRTPADRWSSSGRRPTSIGWRGSAPPRWKPASPPKPLYLRAPDAQPQDAAQLAAPMIGFFSSLFRARRAGAVGSRAPRCRGDRRAACRLVPARLERAGGRRPAARPPRHRASRHAADGKLAGFIMSRLVEDEAEILSVAVARRQRGRGLARRLLDLHLRRLAGLGARAVFLEVDEHNTPAHPALSTAPVFARYRAAPTTIRAPAARPPPRWCCAAIWPDARSMPDRPSRRSICYDMPRADERQRRDHAGQNHLRTEKYRGPLRRQGHAHDRAAPRDRARAGGLRRSSRRRGTVPALRQGRRPDFDFHRLPHGAPVRGCRHHRAARFPRGPRALRDQPPKPTTTI